MQNISKFKSMEVSGIIGFKCARHDFFLPGAVVDLTKGERYSFLWVTKTESYICD